MKHFTFRDSSAFLRFFEPWGFNRIFCLQFNDHWISLAYIYIYIYVDSFYLLVSWGPSHPLLILSTSCDIKIVKFTFIISVIGKWHSKEEQNWTLSTIKIVCKCFALDRFLDLVFPPSNFFFSRPHHNVDHIWKQPMIPIYYLQVAIIYSYRT